MVSYSSIITNSTWVQISNSEDYVLQSKSKHADRVLLVKASATEPTTTDGAIELKAGEVIASTIFSGVIWAKAVNADVLIAYAK